MTRRSSVVVALVVVAVVGVGVGAAQFGALPAPQPALGEPGIFVQKSVLFGIPDFQFCHSANVYKAPAGKKLRIEWMTAEIFLAPSGSDPVDIDVRTTLNNLSVLHPLVRLDDAINFGASFFFTQRWSGPVAIQSQSLAFVEIFACRSTDTGDTNVRVTFHGRLVDQ